jgi:hypothetical protein
MVARLTPIRRAIEETVSPGWETRNVPISLQVAGYAVGLTGAAATQFAVVGGWESFPFLIFPVLWIGAAVFPVRVLTADRDGISTSVRRERLLGWARGTQVVVFGGRGGRVTVGIRGIPGALPIRPWHRVDEFLGRLLSDRGLLAVTGRSRSSSSRPARNGRRTSWPTGSGP